MTAPREPWAWSSAAPAPEPTPSRWQVARAHVAWIAVSCAATWWATRSARDVLAWFGLALVLSLFGASTR